VVLQVLRHLLAGVQTLLDLGVRDVASHDHGAVQRQPGLHGVLAQLGQDLRHRPAQVDLDDVAALEVLVGGLGHEVRRLGLELLDEHALGGDLAQALPIGGAGHRDRDRQGRAVPRQPHHPHVVTEVLAAELRADAHLPGQLQHLCLELGVAEPVRAHGAFGGQRVEVLRRGVLRGLHRELGRRAADHDGQVVGRAGGGAERADLLVEEGHHRRRVQDRLRLLVQVALVRRAAALGHEQELVGVLVAGSGVCVQLDLGGQVRAGVLLLPHGQRRVLGVAQVQLRVGVEHALAERKLVGALAEHLLAALAHDDRGARVLAHRQHAAGGDVGVLHQVEGHELVVRARLGILEDRAQLGQVGRTQVVRDVVHRGLGEELQRLGGNLQERASVRTLNGLHTLGGEEPVGGGVLPGRQHVLVTEFGHDTPLH